jgi:hypothetical protein
MFKSLLTALSLLFITHLSSQSVSGMVQDSKTGEPMERVLIVILEQKKTVPVATTYTNAKGQFSFENLKFKDQEFTLTTKMVGYTEFQEIYKTSQFPLKINIKLDPTASQLKEVDIEGTRARVTIKDDTVSYDAKAFKTHKDANVEDLVTKMPGITREGGEVKAYGEKVQKVLVDGQEFFGEDANIALKNLPAETVDKVEIFDAMSDRNAFTGFNDGNTTKTMNLKTKPGMNKGNFGKGYAGYGTTGRYQLGGNYNYYNGSKRISMLGMANNINNLNFSTSEIVGAMTGSSNMGGAGGANMMRGMSFGMSVSGAGGRRGGFGGPMSNFTVSNRDGINDAYSFGMNYNDKWGKNKNTTVNMSYFGNRTDNTMLGQTNQINLLDTLNTLTTNQNEGNTDANFKHRFSSRIDGKLDHKNSYIWTNKLNFGDNNGAYRTEVNNFFELSGGSLKNINQTSTISRSVDFNTNFLYKYAFNRKGRTFSLNSIVDVNSQKGNSLQNINTERGGLTNIFGLDYVTNQWTSTFTNILTYTEPSGKYGQWLINYSPSFTNRRNDREVSTFNNVNPSPLLADSLSNNFTNNLFYNIGGLSYRLQFSKWRIMFGSNVQNINFQGQERYPGNSRLERNFFGVLPYFNIQFNSSPMNRLRLTYNTNMNVPSITQIQPVLDLSNPVSIYRGNENLTNEYSHNLFFHYMKPNIVKGTFLIFVSNLNYTSNRISSYSYTAVNDTTIDNIGLRRGITYNKNVNMDHAFTGFLFANYTLPIKPLKSNFSINGNYTYSQNPSTINLRENMTRSNMFSLGSMLSSNVSPDVDFSLSYNPKYFINTFSLEGLPNNNYWIHTVANNIRLTLFKNFVWSYDFTYNYNSQIDAAINQHVFLMGSSLAFKFLKNRQLEAKISVFDLLNQNQNISRTITNNAIIDSRVNAMNRYGMFTLTYSIKKFQGSDPDKKAGGFMQMMTPKSD